MRIKKRLGDSNLLSALIKLPANGKISVSFTIASLGIIALALQLSNGLLVERFPKKITYEGSSLAYEQDVSTDISAWALVDSARRFLFASGAPEALNLGIKLEFSADLEIIYWGEYESSECRDNGGYNGAKLIIDGVNLHKSLPTYQGQVHQFSFKAQEPQYLSVSVQNLTNPKCGRVKVTILEKQQAKTATARFILFWVTILFISLWIGVSPIVALLSSGMHVTLLYAEASLSDLSLRTIYIAGALSLILFSLICVVSRICRSSRACTLIIATVVLGTFGYPLVFIAHRYLFSTPFSKESVHAVLQSYTAQGIEFLQSFGRYEWIFLLALAYVLLFWILRSSPIHKSKVRSPLLVGIGLALLALIYVSGNVQNLPSINLVDSALNEYQEELNAYRELENKRKRSKVFAELDSDFSNNLSVFIIGESVNKNHMSAFGYPRKTTPFFDTQIELGNAISLSQAYSNHTHSNPTVSMMLTNANQYKEGSWINSPSVFNFIRAAGLKSSWISNHRMLGGWSNHISVIAREADQVTTINKHVGKGNSAAQYDESLLPIFERTLKEGSNQALFLHFYNSHWNYCNRYPDDNHVFEGSGIENAKFGRKAVQRKVTLKVLNCYDSTIRYSDLLLEKVVYTLATVNEPAILVYTADHGDDVFGANGHNSAVYSYTMSEIPLIIWANDRWRKEHSDIWDALLLNQNAVFTNDLYFELVLGLLGIESDLLTEELNLTSKYYKSIENPVTLHGKTELNGENNHAYWIRWNTYQARRKGIELGILNVGSEWEAKRALQMGIMTLHFSVSMKDSGSLVFGGEHAPVKGNFDRLLKSLDNKGIRKLYLQLDDEGLNANQRIIAMERLTAIVQNVPYSVELISSDQAFVPSTTLNLGDSSFMSDLVSKSGTTQGEILFVGADLLY